MFQRKLRQQEEQARAEAIRKRLAVTQAHTEEEVSAALPSALIEPKTAPAIPKRTQRMTVRKRDRLDPRKVRVNGKLFWQVDLGSEVHGDGKRYRLRKTFASHEEAAAFSDIKKIERKNRGTASISMPERLRGEAIEADRLLEPYNVSLLEVVRQYVERRELSHKSETVKNAVASFLSAKEDDRARKRYLQDLRSRLGRFSRDFAERKVADLTAGELDSWLRDLSLSPLGRNTYHLRIHTLLEYCRTRGWLEKNPLADVPRARVPQDTAIGILSVDQVARLLENADPATLPYWLFAVFCGLRNAELQRLEWSDIHWEEHLVEVPSIKSKTASRRFVSLRQNVLEWLAPYRDSCGPICVPSLYERLIADRHAAGITQWPSNCCRHSFASYHLAHFRDPRELALEMGHTRSEVTFRHYRELVRPSEAERFWKIAPLIDAEQKLIVA
jgi:integrase